MKRLLLAAAAAVVLAGISLAAAAGLGGVQFSPPVAVAYAQEETCFFDRETKPEGQNKTCWYNCVSGPAAVTISAVKLCPLNIRRSRTP